MPFAPLVAPSALSWLGIAREAASGVPALPTAAVPVDGDAYEPEDTPVFVRDEGLRADFGALYGALPGLLSATFNFGGPAYLDSEGFWLDNLLGDLATISNGTLGTAQPLAQQASPGDTTVYASASLGSVVTGSVVQISDGAASETVVATAGSTGTVIRCAGTPCRFAHSITATAALQTAAAGYTHTFAVLNSGTGQPPTHTLTDFTGLTPGTGARSYPSAVVAELALTATAATGLLTAKVAGASWLSAPAAATPALTVPAVVPLAAWASTVALGGTPLGNIATWTVSFKRQMVIYRSPGNGQTPVVIARGDLSVTGGLDYDPAIDETPLDNMLSAGPLPLSIAVSNGLAGAAQVAMTITCSQAQTMRAKPARSSTTIGYDNQWEAIANSTDTGGSGANGPATVTVTNGVAAY